MIGEPRALGRSSGREAAIWFAILAVVTAMMLSARASLNEALVTLAYLLVVQGASARGGRPLGIAIALAAFLCFDLLFLLPYGTLVVQNPLNWLVLVAFLGSSILSAQLLYRAQAEAEVARQRAAEVDRFAALGAETLNVARSEDALTAIAEVIRTTLHLDACSVYMSGTDDDGVRLAIRSADDSRPIPEARNPHDLIEWVASRGAAAAEHVDGTTRVGVDPAAVAAGADSSGRARELMQPLRVRDRTVGVLALRKDAGLALSTAEVRVLEALAYYAALGVERVRLAAEAERAQSLQEAHRAKDAVLASVSHDLRTPLTTIMGLAHEIAADGDDRAAIIEEEAGRLSRLVAQLLDLSRISSGSAAVDIQPNEAEDLLGAAAQQSAGGLRGHELRISVASSDELLFGRFDFSQTLRALVNLIENAAKYSPDAEPVDLSAYRDGAWLVFAVADRGPGIPVAERERIFEPFYRAPGRASDVGGAGLGLSIARGIAVAERGSLAVSDRDGGGSIFSLRVPAMSSAELARGGESPE
ncbi:MAG: ATP-binding region ATPase domain protein [Gemmatimonadetes bacterium]|nr:ATP-binding region ATPase domain protein [Gemmatimonadota bacterium]